MTNLQTTLTKPKKDTAMLITNLFESDFERKPEPGSLADQLMKSGVAEEIRLPYAPRTEQLGRANFTLLQRAIQQPTGPRLSLTFGDRIVDLDREDIDALADYYDEELKNKDARMNFIRIVMSDADNLTDVLRRIGRRTSSSQQDLFQEAKKKDDELGSEIKDVALSRAISKAKADFPTAGSGIEALAKDFMRSQEQDQRTFDQLRQAERQQANLLSQINKLDQQQDQDINDLEDQNSTLARRLQQLQTVNSELEKKIAAMSGRRTEPADKPEVVVPGAAALPTVAAEPVKPAKSKKSKAKKVKAAPAVVPQIAAPVTAAPTAPQIGMQYPDVLLPISSRSKPALAQQTDADDNGIIDVEPKVFSSMAAQLAPDDTVDQTDLSQARQALSKFTAPERLRIKKPEEETVESRKPKT